MAVDTAHIDTVRSFETVYVAADSFILEQTNEHVVANVADVLLDESNGLLYLLDGSEANVKIFNFEGRLLKVLGGKGAGPGEFQAPADIAMDPRGRIAVVDRQLRRLTLFDATGEVVRTVTLADLPRIRDYGIAKDGKYLFVTASREHDEVLAIADTLGSVQRRLLNIMATVPEGEVDGPTWDFPRTFWLGMHGDQVTVAGSLMPRLWSVDLDDMTVRQTLVTFPGYLPPTLPPASVPIRTANDMRRWFYSRHLNGWIETGGSELVWSFVNGELLRNNPAIVLHRTRNGDWEALAGAPIVLAMFADGRLLVFRDPAAERATFVIYARA